MNEQIKDCRYDKLALKESLLGVGVGILVVGEIIEQVM